MSPNQRRLAELLVQAGRVVVERRLVVASGGNLSARIPRSDSFVVTAGGTWLDRLTPDDVVPVGLDGSWTGDRQPSTEWALHAACYRSRPDVAAVMHVHPQTSVLLHALGHPIRLLTTDHVAYVRRVVPLPFAGPGTEGLASAVAAALSGTDCVLLAAHGAVVVGEDVGGALRRVLNLEEAAELTYRALVLGNVDAPGPPEPPDRWSEPGGQRSV